MQGARPNDACGRADCHDEWVYSRDEEGGMTPDDMQPLRRANGDATRNVFRRSNVVHNDCSEWTPTVNTLRHLEEEGFPRSACRRKRFR